LGVVSQGWKKKKRGQAKKSPEEGFHVAVEKTNCDEPDRAGEGIPITDSTGMTPKV